MNKVSPFSQKVYQLVKKVPPGKVTTYKEIAKALNSKAFQAVGQALACNPYPIKVPCHRVIKSNGMISGFCGTTKAKKVQRKISLLKKEGVEFKGQRIKNFKNLFFKLSY